MSTGFDRRRINGPEESFPPIFEDGDNDQDMVVDTKLRKGREAEDIRPICTRLFYERFLFDILLNVSPS
jgi:exosome complex component MTR3